MVVVATGVATSTLAPESALSFNKVSDNVGTAWRDNQRYRISQHPKIPANLIENIFQQEPGSKCEMETRETLTSMGDTEGEDE